MKKKLSPIFYFLGVLLLVVIVALVPELVGGEIETKLRAVLGESYLLVIICIGAGFMALFVLWEYGNKLFGFKKNTEKSSREKVSTENLLQIREGLLGDYQKRLDSKLGARLPINLELKYSLEGTTTKAPLYDNSTIHSTKVKEEISAIFDKHQGRLLIIGEPGSGKTTILLQLAVKLIERGESQIPIIIDIATWRSRFNSVADWLLELLPQMGFSKALSQQVLAENLILPLFDGLDELSAENHQACLEAIGEYGRDHQVRYVICSRIVEYAQAIDAPVRCQLMVKPLTLPQIKKGLKAIDSPETNGLLHAIKSDKLLAEAIKTPFYLNTAQLLFAPMKSWEEFDFKSDTLAGRQAEIVEFFIQDAFGAFKKTNAEKVKKWLSFLGDRMNNKGLIRFELVNLQYSWSIFSKIQIITAKFLYVQVYGLFGGMMAGLFALLFGGLTLGFKESLLIGLLVGLFLGLLIGLFGGLFGSLVRGSELITTREIIKLSAKVWIKIVFTKKVLYGSLFGGLVGGLAFGLTGGLLVGGLFGDIFFGFAGGFVGGLVAGLERVLNESQSYIKTTKPYQRFIASMWFLHFSLFQYLHLKRILYKQDLLPYKLVPFLKEATKHNILESDGGSWRFRHRILQDYFAKHWEELSEE